MSLGVLRNTVSPEYGQKAKSPTGAELKAAPVLPVPLGTAKPPEPERTSGPALGGW
jgi:hypothetical protein